MDLEGYTLLERWYRAVWHVTPLSQEQETLILLEKHIIKVLSRVKQPSKYQPLTRHDFKNKAKGNM